MISYPRSKVISRILKVSPSISKVSPSVSKVGKVPDARRDWHAVTGGGTPTRSQAGRLPAAAAGSFPRSPRRPLRHWRRRRQPPVARGRAGPARAGPSGPVGESGPASTAARSSAGPTPTPRSLGGASRQQLLLHGTDPPGGRPADSGRSMQAPKPPWRARRRLRPGPSRALPVRGEGGAAAPERPDCAGDSAR